MVAMPINLFKSETIGCFLILFVFKVDALSIQSLVKLVDYLLYIVRSRKTENAKYDSFCQSFALISVFIYIFSLF